jgi:alpha-ribazole phosphatase/probable phosphoglycerate mutase
MLKNKKAAAKEKSELYTEIYLIRHCQPDYSLEKESAGDMPLSKWGRQQGRYLLRSLKNLPFDKIYASALKRAQESARPLAKLRKKRLFIDESLNEIDWQNWQIPAYRRLTPLGRQNINKNQAAWQAILDKAVLSVRKTLINLALENPGKRLLLFTHGNFIRLALSSLTGADVFGFNATEIYQSSITKIVFSADGRAKLSFVNDFSHLPSDPGENILLAERKRL